MSASAAEKQHFNGWEALGTGQFGVKNAIKANQVVLVGLLGWDGLCWAEHSSTWPACGANPAGRV